MTQAEPEWKAAHDAAKAAIAARDWAQAIAILRDCISQHPDHVQPAWYSDLVLALVRGGQAAQAAEEAAMMRERWPLIPAGWLIGADAAAALGDWTTAVSLMEAWQARHPDRMTPARLVNLDRARARLQAEQGAPAVASPAAETDGPEALAARAQAAAARNQPSLAVRLWADRAERFPDSMTRESYVAYGRALLAAYAPSRNQGRRTVKEGSEVFALLRERWPDEPLGWEGQATYADWRHDRQVSLTLWRDLITRFPEAAQPHWYERVQMRLFFDGDREGARAVRETLRARWPDYETEWERRGARWLDGEHLLKRAGLAEVEGHLRDGRIEEAKALLASLSEEDQQSHLGRTCAQSIRLLERSDLLPDLRAGGMVDFSRRSSMLVWRNPEGGDRVIIAFSGGGVGFWFTLEGMHRVLRGCRAHIIYMRDFSGTLYLAGDPEAGLNYMGLIAKLKEQVAALGASRIACLGNSSGGYGAMRYGLDLGAEGVLSFSGMTTTSDRHDPRFDRRYAEVEQASPGLEFDLVAAYGAAANPPRVTLCFSEGHESDREQAERMRHLPNVRLVPAPGEDGHNSIRWFVSTGRFFELIDDLFPPTGA